LLPKPVHITVREGVAVRISGGQEARRIQSLLRPHGRKSRMILEIGIGTNPKAKMTGLIPEDQKVMGIGHVSLGNSLLWNGRHNSRCTFDGVILSPTLVIDRKTVVESGVLQV
jgi:leucyl aminopeptidase (aminopeptidase T)